MFAQQQKSISSPIVINSLEALLEYIDAEPAYPFTTNDLINNYYQLDDDLGIIEETSNEQYTTLSQSLATDKMNMMISYPSDSSRTNSFDSSEASSINSFHHNDEISFDRKEWRIRDSSTGRIRAPKIYEFLLLLVNNSRYISYASWLNKNEGLFKIHKPSEVAKLWNKVKGRRTTMEMDYEKFSRSIRYHYDNEIMIATYKKHTYRFGIYKS